MLVTALVMALIISTRLSQVFLVVIPLLIIAVVIVIKRVGPFFTSLQGATDQLNLVVQEDLNAIRVVKSFVREAQERRSSPSAVRSCEAWPSAPSALWCCSCR